MGRRRDIVPLLLAFSASLAIPAWAQPCDDACFLIQNTFDQETLRRYLQAFPEGRHADLARSRLSSLDDLGRRASRGDPDAFGPVHRVPTVPVHPTDRPPASAR